MKRKYELIIEHVKEQIEGNQLRQGKSIPSIREMAAEFNCNKSTVIRAYQELENQHIVYSIPKGGYYVVDRKSKTNIQYNKIDFTEVMPDPLLLPYKEFNHCINRAVETYKDSLFIYSDTQGLLSLRKTLVRHFNDYHVYTSEENIFITSGAQQALSILSRMPFPNTKTNILVEQPTYSLMNRLVEMNNDKLIGIPRDLSGIDFAELERIFKYEEIKFFYTIPRFHNPLGTCYSEKDKQKIVELAERYNIYIVEDDYLVDIDIGNKTLPLYYYDLSKRVIYIKSFSKSFMPGIRIGAVVINDELKKEFTNYKKCFDLNTSVLAQGALEIFINCGMYKKHKKKIQLEYRKKCSFLKELIANEKFDNLEVFVPKNGFFTWIRLPKEINLNQLIRRLSDKGISISSGDSFYLQQKSKENSIRLCISKLSIEEIQAGVAVLMKEIKALY